MLGNSFHSSISDLTLYKQTGGHMTGASPHLPTHLRVVKVCR